MKKIFYLITVFTLCISLQACVYIDNDKPSPIAIGIEIGQEAVDHISTTVKITEMSRLIDIWSKATTEEEKYIIEDEYFPNVKIRQITPDTIKVGILYTINTFGKSLTETPWEVIPLKINNSKDFVYKVNQVSESIYQLSLNENTQNSTVQLTMEIVSDFSTYKIETESKNIAASNLYYQDKVDYKTVQPIILDNQLSSKKTLWDSYYYPIEGELNINVYLNDKLLNNDETTLIFNCYDTQVLFRGHDKDTWGIKWDFPLF